MFSFGLKSASQHESSVCDNILVGVLLRGQQPLLLFERAEKAALHLSAISIVWLITRIFARSSCCNPVVDLTT